MGLRARGHAERISKGGYAVTVWTGPPKKAERKAHTTVDKDNLDPIEWQWGKA